MTTGEKIRAYVLYCDKNKLPKFAPASGVCWYCRKQIFDRIEDPEQCITGCPWCNRTYCD